MDGTIRKFYLHGLILKMLPFQWEALRKIFFNLRDVNALAEQICREHIERINQFKLRVKIILESYTKLTLLTLITENNIE